MDPCDIWPFLLNFIVLLKNINIHIVEFNKAVTHGVEIYTYNLHDGRLIHHFHLRFLPSDLILDIILKV